MIVNSRKFLIISLLIASLILILKTPKVNAQAQEEEPWSPARNIPLYHPETSTPYLIADENRTIHVFSSQYIDSEGGVRAIFYNKRYI